MQSAVQGMLRKTPIQGLVLITSLDKLKQSFYLLSITLDKFLTGFVVPHRDDLKEFL
jgi:hypothetical protein